MHYLLQFSRLIDGFSDLLMRGLRWVVVALIVLGVINVVGRYLGAQIGMQLSSNALLEAQTQAYNLIFLLAAAGLLARDGHIRVDILNVSLPQRLRLWIDIVGHALLLIPFCLLMLWFAWDYVMRAWSRLQVSPHPDGLPLYPIKTVILIAFVLLVLQAVSEIIKRVDRLRRLAHGAGDGEAG